MLKTNKEIEEIFNRKFRGPFGNTLGDSNDSLFFLLSQRKEDIAEIQKMIEEMKQNTRYSVYDEGDDQIIGYNSALSDLSAKLSLLE